MQRRIGEWELMSVVEFDNDVGPMMCIWAHDRGRDIHRRHVMEGFHPNSNVEATRLVDETLAAVTGVSADGSLQFTLE